MKDHQFGFPPAVEPDDAGCDQPSPAMGRYLAKKVAQSWEQRRDWALFARGDHTPEWMRDQGKPPHASDDEVDRWIDDWTDSKTTRLIALRGGCRCQHPTTMPPCSVCTEPVNRAEAAHLMEDEDAAPPPAAGPIVPVPGRVYLVAINAKKAGYSKFFEPDPFGYAWGHPRGSCAVAASDSTSFYNFNKFTVIAEVAP